MPIERLKKISCTQVTKALCFTQSVKGLFMNELKQSTCAETHRGPLTMAGQKQHVCPETLRKMN